MNKNRLSIGRRLANALFALVAMSLAFGPPLDAAAHAASNAVEAGSEAPALMFLSAFDVLDDEFDRPLGELAGDTTQVVIQLALPDPAGAEVAAPILVGKEIWPTVADAWSSRTPSPMERPPRN